MTNAAQAIGERSGRIEIDAAIVEGRAEPAISDDGIGFPEELLEAGVHEHGSFRTGGSGFWLATARRFVFAHGSDAAFGESVRQRCDRGTNPSGR